ncbi:MAG: MlaD family protein [candidate division WOR-3 bacterium]
MTLEEKVGLTAFLLLILFVAAFFVTKDFTLKRNRTSYEVVFSGPVYLRKGDPVEVLGVPYGKIENIYIENGKVIVRFNLQKFKISEDSKILLESSGILGQFRLLIIPGNGQLATPGMRFVGDRGKTFDELLAKVSFLMDSLNLFFSKICSTVNDAKKLGKEIDKSLKVVSSSITALKDTVFHLISSGDDEIRQFVNSLYGTLKNLDSLLVSLHESAIVRNDSLFNKLEVLTEELIELSRTLKEKGVPVRVRIF